MSKPGNFLFTAAVSTCLLSGMLFSPTKAADAQPAATSEETPAQRDARLQWWQDARFGMFIHWGPVSLKGTEIGWSRGAQIPIDEYDQLYTRFDPVKFNADEWVSIAKATGMKYMVFTSKHHDGFCMWDTKETDFNVMRSPFGRDVIKELSAACKRAGLPFCTYHSVCDWHHPDFPRTSPGGRVRRDTHDVDRYETYLRAQVKELITQYGPLGIMWFDVPQEFDPQRGLGLETFTRTLQPNIIINNRSGARGDYDTPEQRVGKYQDDRPWETCMTICRQWAWKPDDNMKSLKECLQTLVRCAGGDGNLLFNVGPMPDGRIEPRQVDRLKEMGAWLATRGEAVYATRGGPWKPTRALASTRKDDTVFLHVFRWDEDRITLPGLPVKVLSASLLPSGAIIPTRYGKPLSVARLGLFQTDDELIVSVPESARDEIDTVIRLKIEGSALDLEPIALTPTVKASASNVFLKQDAHYGPEFAFDNDESSRWATDAGTRHAWVAVDFLRPLTAKRVRIEEAYPGRVQKFEFQYRESAEWKPLFAGTTLGRWFQRQFEPVTAQEFRLNILEATEGPTITDIELFEK